MRDGMRRCAVEHEGAQWNTKMRDGMQRCATMRTKRERGNASRECGKVSWVHDSDVVL
jgi:hypothetical protein